MREQQASAQIDAQVDEFLDGNRVSKRARAALRELFEIEANPTVAGAKRVGQLLRDRCGTVKCKAAMLITDIAHPMVEGGDA